MTALPLSAIAEWKQFELKKRIIFRFSFCRIFEI